MSLVIQHDADLQRFTARVDGHDAFVEYELRDGILAIPHTIVPSAIGGRGIAGELVRRAFDHARSEGLKVAPICSYAEAWARKHSEYADLVS